MKAGKIKIIDLTGLLYKQKKIVFCWLLIVIAHMLFAQSIDIGIFESTVASGQIDVKIRPDFDIAEDETVTAILYTIRWNDPLITINTEFIYPFFISPQGPPVEYNGYYYQVFGAVPVNAMAMNANQEYIASSFTYTNGDCARFEIIEDEWTQANNGNVYFEFLGEDVTGMIYNPVVELGSVGGVIEGGGTINLGESTGDLTLSDYTGNINIWQHRLDEGTWSDISFTAGLVSYSETPTIAGLWEYRCEVQEGTCPAEYSETAQVIVLDTIVSTRPGIESIENTVEIFSDGNIIYLKSTYSKRLKGKLTVYSLLGRKIFNENISEVKIYTVNPESHGIQIITFFDESTNKLYKEKVLLR